MKKKNEIKTYKIPVTFQMYGVYSIEASSLEEAKTKAIDSELPLPDNYTYLDDSIQIDTEGIDILND